ncbi:hypothetical protein Q3C01_35525 [Bradyrhizobium sp. UFLA05-109]
MKVRSHSKSHVVELDDGSVWQIFPGDLNKTLAWKPETDLHLERIIGGISTHVLVSASDHSRVRVILAGEIWPVEEVKDVLQDEAEGKQRL